MKDNSLVLTWDYIRTQARDRALFFHIYSTPGTEDELITALLKALVDTQDNLTKIIIEHTERCASPILAQDK